MAGSVSRARYKRRPKGNFLTGVITRPCVHTSSPATFPQLLAQLAPSPASMRRQLLHATASWRRIRRIRTRLPIDQLNHSATNVSGNVIGRGRSDFFPRMIGIFFFCFVRSFVCFCFFFFRRGIRGRNFNDWNTLVRYIKSYFHRFHGFYSDSRKELIMIIEKNTWFYKLCVWCCLIHRFLNCNFFFYVVWLEKELL